MPRRDHIEWISGRFLGRDVGFPNNTTWRLTEVLAEKSTSFDEGPQEASAVFSCVQTGGSKINGEAIVRIRMQIPNSETSLYPDAKHRAKEASKEPTIYATMEETALKELTRLQCPYTPKLYSLSEREQDLSMWVPGGWLILILIEKLPGQPPWNFWCETKDGPAMTLPQRNEVRTAFKEALSAVFKHGFKPRDTKIDNILWDKASRKCYIIDLEEFEDWRDAPVQLEFRDNLFIRWGLTRRDNKTRALVW